MCRTASAHHERSGVGANGNCDDNAPTIDGMQFRASHPSSPTSPRRSPWPRFEVSTRLRSTSTPWRTSFIGTTSSRRPTSSAVSSRSTSVTPASGSCAARARHLGRDAAHRPPGDKRRLLAVFGFDRNQELTMPIDRPIPIHRSAPDRLPSGDRPAASPELWREVVRTGSFHRCGHLEEFTIGAHTADELEAGG